MPGIIGIGWIGVDRVILVSILIVVVSSLGVVTTLLTRAVTSADVRVLVVLSLLPVLVVMLLWVVFLISVVLFLSKVSLNSIERQRITKAHPQNWH